jgi:hypothetical protein
MAYIVFEFDQQRDVPQFIAGLAFMLLQPIAKFKQLETFPRQKIPSLNMTLDELVALIIPRIYSSPKLTIATKVTLKTDKHLIDSFGDKYIGIISSKEKKQLMLQRFEFAKTLRQYDEIKKRFVLNKWELINSYRDINFANADAEQFVGMCANAAIPLIKWLDEHSQSVKNEQAALPPFIQRNF